MIRYLNIIRVFLAGATVLLFVSCDVNDSNNSRHSYSFQIKQQSVIEIDTTRRSVTPDGSITILSISIEPGNNTVFKFNHSFNDPDIVDEEYSEILVFQIQGNVEEFEIRGRELNEAKAFYGRSCFCPISGATFEVTGGVIRGRRLSDSNWIVNADVTVESILGSVEVKFEELFRPG